MIFLLVTGGFCLLSIFAFLILVRKSGAKPTKVVPVREQEFKNLFGIKGFRRDFVETEGGTIAFFRIMPNNLTVLPEAVIEYQIEQMKQLLQNEDDLSVFCTDGSEIGEENVRFFKKRIAEEKRPEIKDILQKDMESFETRHRQRTSLKQFFILLTMDSSWTDEMLYTRASEIGKKLHEHGFANSMLEQSGIRHLLGIYFSGSMYAEQWKEEDFYEYVTRDRVKEEKNKEPGKKKKKTNLISPTAVNGTIRPYLQQPSSSSQRRHFPRWNSVSAGNLRRRNKNEYGSQRKKKRNGRKPSGRKLRQKTRSTGKNGKRNAGRKSMNSPCSGNV